MRSDRLLTLSGFLDAFASRHQDRLGRPFCFLLGAGASEQSRIPGGPALARELLELLHKQEDFEGLSLEKWATPVRLGIPGFHWLNPACFYPELFTRCFGERAEDGCAFLEKLSEGREPSYGYSVLAFILANTLHKVVITTNFDNLLADAFSIHSPVSPIVTCRFPSESDGVGISPGTSGLDGLSDTASSCLWNFTLTIRLTPCSCIVTP